jgi:hypothetical protein
LENDQDPGESGTQELENDQDQEPEIHRNAHRPLSRMARAAAALLASPFQRRSPSKYAGRRPSMSSTSSRSSDESNGHAAFDLDEEEDLGDNNDLDEEEGDLGDDNDLDQEEDLGDSNDQPNGYTENPVPPTLIQILRWRKSSVTIERMEVSLKAPTSLPWGKQWSRMTTSTLKVGLLPGREASPA